MPTFLKIKYIRILSVKHIDTGVRIVGRIVGRIVLQIYWVLANKIFNTTNMVGY